MQRLLGLICVTTRIESRLRPPSPSRHRRTIRNDYALRPCALPSIGHLQLCGYLGHLISSYLSSSLIFWTCVCTQYNVYTSHSRLHSYMHNYTFLNHRITTYSEHYPIMAKIKKRNHIKNMKFYALFTHIRTMHGPSAIVIWSWNGRYSDGQQKIPFLIVCIFLVTQHWECTT